MDAQASFVGVELDGCNKAYFMVQGLVMIGDVLKAKIFFCLLLELSYLRNNPYGRQDE